MLSAVDSCEDVMDVNAEFDVEFSNVFLNLPAQYSLTNSRYKYAKLPPYPAKCKTYAATGKCMSMCV